MDKKHIQIFVGNQNDNSCCSTSSCCCCGTPTDSIVFDDLLEKYVSVLEKDSYFSVYNVSDNQENDQLINSLNEVLHKSGERLTVDKSNLDFVLSQSAPIIAVDGIVVSMKNYPDEKQLYEAVMHGKKIPLSKGCC